MQEKEGNRVRPEELKKSLQRVTGIKTGQLRTVNETRKDLRPKIADEHQGPAVRKKVKGTGVGLGPMNCQTDPPRIPSGTMAHTEEKLLGVESKCNRVGTIQRKERNKATSLAEGKRTRISQKASQTK